MGLHVVSLSAICLAVGTLLFSPIKVNLTNELEAQKRLVSENSQTRCPLTESLINVNPEELSALIEQTYSDNGEEVLEVHQENILLNQDGSVSVDLTLQNKAHVTYGAAFSIETGTIVSEVIVSLVNTDENTSLPLTPQITQHLGTITFCPGSHLRLHLNKFGFNVKDASYLLFLDAMTALSVFGGAGYLPERPVDLAKNIAIDEILEASGLDTIVFSRQLQNEEYIAAFRTLAKIIVEEPQIWAAFLLREYGIRISTAALQKLSAGLYLFLGAREIFPILRDLIQKPREVEVEIIYSPNLDNVVRPVECMSNTNELAFVSEGNGNNEIYLVASNGSNVRNLTNNLASDGNFVWSPDGRQIAFESDRDGKRSIYIMNADGSNVRKIAENGSDFLGLLKWSPNGDQLLFGEGIAGEAENFRLGDLFIIDVPQGSITPLTYTPQRSRDNEFVWSPDGTRIAFVSNDDTVSNSEIYVINSDGSNALNLTNTGVIDYSPTWSPDGSQIAYMSFADSSYEIYVMNIDMKNTRRLTHNDISESSLAWSPDGTKISFVSNLFSEEGGEIYVMNSDGSAVRKLTHNNYEADHPSWSPDGSQIAFVSYKNMEVSLFLQADIEIFVMTAEGTEVRRVPDSSTFVTRSIFTSGFPTWRPCIAPEIVDLSSILDITASRPWDIADANSYDRLWKLTEFRDTHSPSNQNYEVSISASTAYRFNFTWCADTTSRLEEILAPLKVSFFIAGVELSNSYLLTTDTETNQQACRIWDTILSNWQSNMTVELEIRYSLNTPIFDGWQTYEAGTYSHLMKVNAL